MISRENVIKMMNEQFRADKCTTIKRTLKGTIDMRYTSNIRIFSEIYKQQLIDLNRRDNGLVDGPMEETNDNYRDEINNYSDEINNSKYQTHLKLSQVLVRIVKY